MQPQYENIGRYVLLEKLATGGMAEVFLARGIGADGIGKFFAIKRILPQYADNPEFIEMFKHEASIAKNLKNANIVSVIDFESNKNQFYLIMDYVEGRNLRQILNKMKKTSTQFSQDQIVYIIKQVAAGLEHAHRCLNETTNQPLNIIHRDMSPQNVMVSFEGEVKIVDFGIAKAESQIENTRAGTLKGKFGYMSPEQAEGQPVDLRTDIFSLGIVLWELLANDRLFTANNEINTLRKIRDCQVPSLRKINPNIHVELERITMKALARDRNLRYQTAAALHRDLNRFLNRQFPEFNPLDFAIFIKNIFNDEIFALRKRLMEYSKVNLNVSLNIDKAAANAGMRGRPANATVATQVTSTSSMVSSADNSAVSLSNSTSATEAHRPNSTSATLPTVNTVKSLPATDVNEAEATQALDESQSISDFDRTIPSLPDVHAPPATQPPPSPKVTLDEAALSKGMTPPSAPAHNSSRAINLETEEVTSPSYRRSERTGIRTRPQASGSGMSLATAMFFAAFCLATYAYLVKYYPFLMEPAIRSTYAYAPQFYDALIGDRQLSGDGQTPYIPTPRSKTEAIKSLAPDDPTGLIVTSTPSGAEIWLNGLNTGSTTPQRIDVDPIEPFTITVRKRGYRDYERLNVTRESVGRKVDANLEKMNIGYVTVEIFPPQEARVFVNGKAVTLNRAQARDVMVPANSTIKVRAESKSGETYEEATVTVGLDQRKNVRLNPRKFARQPTSTEK